MRPFKECSLDVNSVLRIEKSLRCDWSVRYLCGVNLTLMVPHVQVTQFVTRYVDGGWVGMVVVAK